MKVTREKLDEAVKSLKTLDPTAWSTIGNYLLKLTVPREGGNQEELAFKYIEKKAIVDIIEILGFEV